MLVHSSKTLKRGMTPTVLALPRIPGSIVCLAEAWDRYSKSTALAPEDPAFIGPSGTPLTSNQLVLVMQAALRYMGCPHASQVSSHSLHRGGAQAATLAGSDRSGVAAHGT